MALAKTLKEGLNWGIIIGLAIATLGTFLIALSGYFESYTQVVWIFGWALFVSGATLALILVIEE